jgi:hypothetical protein
LDRVLNPSAWLQAASILKPAIAHFSMTVEGFSVDPIKQALTDHRVMRGDPGPMKTWLGMRGPHAGEGTPVWCAR